MGTFSASFAFDGGCKPIVFSCLLQLGCALLACKMVKAMALMSGSRMLPGWCNCAAPVHFKTSRDGFDVDLGWDVHGDASLH